jgi:hypothetical protein
MIARVLPAVWKLVSIDPSALNLIAVSPPLMATKLPFPPGTSARASASKTLPSGFRGTRLLLL